MSFYGHVIFHWRSPKMAKSLEKSPPTPNRVGGDQLSTSVWSVWLLIDVCGGGRLFNELGCLRRVRHVSHMAGIHFDSLGAGALRHHPLLLGTDGSVLRGANTQGGFCF